MFGLRIKSFDCETKIGEAPAATSCRENILWLQTTRTTRSRPWRRQHPVRLCLAPPVFTNLRLTTLGLDSGATFGYFVRIPDKAPSAHTSIAIGRQPLMLQSDTLRALVASLLLAVPLASALGSEDGVQADQSEHGSRKRAQQASRPFQPPEGDLVVEGAICYGPHRDGQWPGGPSPTPAQIRADLLIMQRHWRLVRTYGASEFGRELLEAIRCAELDLQVMLGAWIAPVEPRDAQGALGERDPDAAAANRREVAAAIALARDFPELVAAVCVGNETQVSWSPHPSPPESVIDYVRQVRAAIEQPVTTADDYQYWRKPESRTMAREIDFITVHAHPLWNGQQLDEALPWLREQIAAVRSIHPERPLVIGETGWATSKSDAGEQARLMKGRTGEGEQARFYADARAWSVRERLTVFFFEAFDENWKGGADPRDAEKHWGFYRADRTPKLAVQ
ncbi:MAG: hypothetical protein GF330_07220 [Candidatus Eisenbacteria bacterium]|nr:hypothetical protein [Candidatus Eisenbacteria bacterium]